MYFLSGTTTTQLQLLYFSNFLAVMFWLTIQPDTLEDLTELGIKYDEGDNYVEMIASVGPENMGQGAATYLAVWERSAREKRSQI